MIMKRPRDNEFLDLDVENRPNCIGNLREALPLSRQWQAPTCFARTDRSDLFRSERFGPEQPTLLNPIKSPVWRTDGPSPTRNAATRANKVLRSDLWTFRLSAGVHYYRKQKHYSYSSNIRSTIRLQRRKNEECTLWYVRDLRSCTGKLCRLAARTHETFGIRTDSP